MPLQPISGTVSDKNLQAIKDALAAIESVLPFLITLTDDERKALRNTGEGRLPFVLDAGEVAQNNPDILPKAFDTADFESVVALFNALTEILTLVDQTRSKIDDTRLAAGAQALSGASDVYHYAQDAAKKTPGLKPIVERMGQQFQKAAATRRANTKAKLAAAGAK